MEKIFGYDEMELKRINAYITAKEIRQQPRLWEETFNIIRKNKEKIIEFLDKVLKEKNIRIIFTGAGTSAFVGECVVPYLDRIYSQKFEAIPTTSIVSNPENYLHSDVPTLLISCARSGNSPESVATVELAEKLVDNLYQIFLTCNPEGSLAKKALQGNNSLLLLMPEDSNDKGFAMTGSFTCMVLASLLFFDIKNINSLESDIQAIVSMGERILEKYPEKIKSIAHNDFDRAIFLGSSTLMGLARESALKVLELTRGIVMTNWDSSLGFRHGPKSVINEKTLIFTYLSNDSYTRQYEIDLLKEMNSENGNKKIIGISNYLDKEIENIVDYFIYIEEVKRNYEDDVYLIFDYILIAQMFAFFKSIELGISPDNPCPDGSVNRVVKGVKIYPYF
ncbi:SIS domain-containing protein [Caloranaerobacter azorensis]|uniref:SIS domain-containing protein n=1 Tax=Caloranaerobacter azorensis TaxID=116090 RepID=A0A6P1YHB4_9FIRM|nr:SIS domain-containing protein [Caloranaerobacter azorensis]QIB27605.1 SIS domain-containing protein [Caloranaerobacter azorensis]